MLEGLPLGEGEAVRGAELHRVLVPHPVAGHAILSKGDKIIKLCRLDYGPINLPLIWSRAAGVDLVAARQLRNFAGPFDV